MILDLKAGNDQKQGTLLRVESTSTYRPAKKELKRSLHDGLSKNKRNQRMPARIGGLDRYYLHRSSDV